ncbi:MAG: type I-E CRISPR-associated protein Cas5/CasD [Micropruina sp.]|nr:type I-E CRISPR-associated protein Cas5/CasD [Micropruina sp.]
MSVLLLRLAGPMQSWGVDSRFSRRETLRHPTKSGVLGLLAAAAGRRRTDPIEDLVGLRFGVRVDQPGRIIRDFHTAHDWRSGASMPLSERFYLSDAVFVAGVEGDPSLLEALDEAIREPKFQLFLGRRSCPVSGRLSLGVQTSDLETSLRDCDWQASEWHRRRLPQEVTLQLVLDAHTDGSPAAEVLRDEPISFDPRRREHGWRRVARRFVQVSNPKGNGVDFFAAAGGL